jgi:hypothetical protein
VSDFNIPRRVEPVIDFTILTGGERVHNLQSCANFVHHACL